MGREVGTVRVHPPNVPHFPIKSARKPTSDRYIQQPSARYNGNPRFSIHSSRSRKPQRTISPVVLNAPVSPHEALAKYGMLLNSYEREEILSFPEIYYLGQPNRKITPNENDPSNYGFDNETSNYNLIAGDHLAYRFEILALFGAGAFGQVARCFDHKTQTQVAIKVVVNTEQMHEQGRIEAQILARLNKADVRGVVKAYDFFIFRSHICITFEVLSKNLFEVIEAGNYKPLSPKLVRLFALQVLTAIDSCHRLGVVHCDLKPENVLLVKGSSSVCKVIDFGSSCFTGRQIYEYIQSRFYRAPEVMIGIPYGPPMDVWSSALIFVELLTGTPLFPGENEEEELWMITELLGPPPPALVAAGKRRAEFFDDEGNLKTEQSAPRKPKSMDLFKVLKTKDELLVDFLLRCLTWDQGERMTAAEALQHPWIRAVEVAVPKKTGSTGLPELK